MRITKSRYAKKYTFTRDLKQLDALGFHLDNLDHDQREIMDNIQEYLVNVVDVEAIRPENPCHYGLTFSGIEKGKQELDIVCRTFMQTLSQDIDHVKIIYLCACSGQCLKINLNFIVADIN